MTVSLRQTLLMHAYVSLNDNTNVPNTAYLNIYNIPLMETASIFIFFTATLITVGIYVITLSFIQNFQT